MENELEEKLKVEVETADWSMLEEHANRESVFLISDRYDLVKIGCAIAKDDSSLISTLLGNKELQKVTDEIAKKYKSDPKAKIFKFLIVQPYVIIQE